MSYEVAGQNVWIPLDHIYVDPEFNCRGSFTPHDVYSLAENIKVNGQIEPLIIQPISDVPEDEQPSPCDRIFRLLAGHRRYMAIDKWTPDNKAICSIRKGLTRQQAKALNFIENLQRKDLNLLEEARALSAAWPEYSVLDVARIIGKPKRWVEVRFGLLQLPKYIQNKARLDKSLGGLSQYDVELLIKEPPSKVEALFQKIVTCKDSNNKPKEIQSGKRRKSPYRGQSESQDLIAFLMRWFRVSTATYDQIGCIASTIAWLHKGILSKEFLESRVGFPPDSIIVDDDDKVIGIKGSDGDIIEC